MDAADFIQILVAALCAAVAVVALRQRGSTRPLSGRFAFYFALVLGLANLFTLGIRRLSPGPQFVVAIPSGGDHVAATTGVVVKAVRGKPANALWLVVYSSTDKAFYPYRTQQVDRNHWSATIPVGRTMDSGKR